MLFVFSRVLLNAGFDIFYDVADGMKVFHVFFFDGDAPFVFGVHQKFHDVQTVRADVFDNIGIFGDFAFVDAELFSSISLILSSTISKSSVSEYVLFY